MRAILIDPVDCVVAEINIEPGLSALYAALNCRSIDIRSVGHAPNRSPIDLICDDEGRLIDGQRCFRLGGGLLIAGRALLLSHDEIGATTACALPLQDAAAQVRFLPEGFDYTPPPPIVIGFKSIDMLQFIVR